MGQNTPISAFCLVFYMSFCLLDIYLGFTKYGKHMNTLSYIHHTFYTGVTAYLLLVKQCGDQFMLMMVFEVPTIALALGHVSHDALRSDWVFGALFFLSRIVYHFFISSVFIYHLGFDSRTILVLASIPMHLYWFYGWGDSMRKKTTRRASVSSEPIKEKQSPVPSPVLARSPAMRANAAKPTPAPASPHASPKFAPPRFAPLA